MRKKNNIHIYYIMKKIGWKEGINKHFGDLEHYKDKKGGEKCASVQKYWKRVKCLKGYEDFKIPYVKRLTIEDLIKESGYKGNVSKNDRDYISSKIYYDNRNFNDEIFNDTVQFSGKMLGMKSAYKLDPSKETYDKYLFYIKKYKKDMGDYNKIVEKGNKRNIENTKKYFEQKYKKKK